jgi:hypothetical protein
MGGCQLELRFSKVRGATILLRDGSASAQSSFPKDRAVWGAASRPIRAIGGRPPLFSVKGCSGRSAFYRVRPNRRMKLSCRSGHDWWNWFFLIVAAPARSLCAIR